MLLPKLSILNPYLGMEILEDLAIPNNIEIQIYINIFVNEIIFKSFPHLDIHINVDRLIRSKLKRDELR